MTIPKLVKKEIIETLVISDTDLIFQCANNSDIEFLTDILTNGFKGYAEYPEKELIREWEERTSQDINDLLTIEGR